MADLGGGHNLSTEVGGSHSWSPATNELSTKARREEYCELLELQLQLPMWKTVMGVRSAKRTVRNVEDSNGSEEHEEACKN